MNRTGGDSVCGGGEQIEADDSFTITQLKRSERVMGACRVCCVPHFTAVFFSFFLFF